jgi:hypothetical protein
LTSALSLQRPVAFVGDHWKRHPKYDLEADLSHALDSLREATRDRFNKSRGSDALDPRDILEAVRLGLGAHLGHYRYFDSQATASVVVGWILAELRDSGTFRGRFLDIKGHKVAAEEYEQWLTKFAYG